MIETNVRTEKTGWATRLIKFFRDCKRVTDEIEIYLSRMLIVLYGFWHIYEKLKH